MSVKRSASKPAKQPTGLKAGRAKGALKKPRATPSGGWTSTAAKSRVNLRRR